MQNVIFGMEAVMDSELRELLQSDHIQTVKFFAVNLLDVCESQVDQQELLYNASVLAHYAQVSTCSSVDFPVPANLSVVFDRFVCDKDLLYDGETLEVAGAQCLLMSGFFENQMRCRHNIGWYSKHGTSFFIRAAARETSLPKARLLNAIARDFEPWRKRHARLSRDLRDRPYLLSPLAS
ncbi:MAG: hypothetical protein WAX85_03150 [Minisyncoccia bacterium]